MIRRKPKKIEKFVESTISEKKIIVRYIEGELKLDIFKIHEKYKKIETDDPFILFIRAFYRDDISEYFKLKRQIRKRIK